MSYSAARSVMGKYRDGKLSSLLGESSNTWFTELWGGIGDMLDTFESSSENKDIASSYAEATAAEKTVAHVRLDYVCGLRREVRKQYVSGDDGVYTDVTPFRHGVISTNGARIFDDVLDSIMTKTADGGQ